MKESTDKKLAARMEASMNKIVDLTKKVHSAEKDLNSARVALSLQIYDWITIATESGIVTNLFKAYSFVSQRNKMGMSNVAAYYRVGRTIEEQKLNPTVVHYGAVFQLNAYGGVMSEATKHTALAATRQGAAHSVVRRIITKDRKVRASMTMKRVEAQAEAGQLSMDHLKIEMMAVQTYAQKLYGKNCIVSVTDEDYVPLCEVGKKHKMAHA